MKKRSISPEGEIINLIERKYEWRPLKYPIVKRGPTALMLPEKEHFSITLLKAAIEEVKANELLLPQRAGLAADEINKWIKEQNKEIENGRYEFIDDINSLSVRHIQLDALQKIRHDIQKRVDRLDILKLSRITSLGDLTKKLRERRDIIDKEIELRTH